MMAYVRVIDLREHPPTLPDDDPHLKLLPSPGIRRNGVMALGFSHCIDCHAPITVFLGFDRALSCTECTADFMFQEQNAKHEPDEPAATEFCGVDGDGDDEPDDDPLYGDTDDDL